MTSQQASQEIVHLFVEGRVQGVGFRYATQRKATELGLGGWVKNTSDGRVEIEATGPTAIIEQFLTFCRTGPDHAKVTDVWVVRRENAVAPSPPSFSIQ